MLPLPHLWSTCRKVPFVLAKWFMCRHIKIWCYNMRVMLVPKNFSMYWYQLIHWTFLLHLMVNLCTRQSVEQGYAKSKPSPLYPQCHPLHEMVLYSFQTRLVDLWCSSIRPGYNVNYYMNYYERCNLIMCLIPRIGEAKWYMSLTSKIKSNNRIVVSIVIYDSFTLKAILIINYCFFRYMVWKHYIAIKH